MGIKHCRPSYVIALVLGKCKSEEREKDQKVSLDGISRGSGATRTGRKETGIGSGGTRGIGYATSARQTGCASGTKLNVGCLAGAKKVAKKKKITKGLNNVEEFEKKHLRSSSAAVS